MILLSKAWEWAMTVPISQFWKILDFVVGWLVGGGEYAGFISLYKKKEKYIPKESYIDICTAQEQGLECLETCLCFMLARSSCWCFLMKFLIGWPSNVYSCEVEIFVFLLVSQKLCSRCPPQNI